MYTSPASSILAGDASYWYSRLVGSRRLPVLIVELDREIFDRVVRFIVKLDCRDARRECPTNVVAFCNFTCAIELFDEHVGLIRSSGWKHQRWLDTVMMQRALGLGDLTTPHTGTP